jgi:hypothetical protein
MDPRSCDPISWIAQCGSHDRATSSLFHAVALRRAEEAYVPANAELKTPNEDIARDRISPAFSQGAEPSFSSPGSRTGSSVSWSAAAATVAPNGLLITNARS